jgi:hypothetical protein
MAQFISGQWLECDHGHEHATEANHAVLIARCHIAFLALPGKLNEGLNWW